MNHELFPETSPSGDAARRHKRLCVDNADHILCISECTANNLVRLLGVRRDKISVTHLGYSSVFTDAPPDREAATRDLPYLLYIGQRTGFKNFDMALKAYASSAALRNVFDVVAFGGRPLTRENWP